jgi:hypothetical protein
MIDLIKKNTQRFPLCSETSIFVDFYTKRAELTTIGVLKNVLDAMNGVLYTDDRKVKTALVKKHIVNDIKKDLIRVAIMDSQPIMSLNDTAESYKKHIIQHRSRNSDCRFIFNDAL